ncbi:unnamed protein product [Dibothriocephalus latus]|uniref:Uncharacterized protein n=1 Tax=Dibothriocephalus latus TaxID=60516 RepID=A0A3P6QKQ6_DIBLA|nr:unnamed protein product [Dibothriocephalus latus]
MVPKMCIEWTVFRGCYHRVSTAVCRSSSRWFSSKLKCRWRSEKPNKAEPHLRNRDIAIRLVIDVVDCLNPLFILSIASLAENVVQQRPVPQSEMHQRCFLPCQEAKLDVGRQEAMFSTGSQNKKVIRITAAKAVDAQCSLRGSVICPKAGVKDIKGNQLVRLQHKR